MTCYNMVHSYRLSGNILILPQKKDNGGGKTVRSNRQGWWCKYAQTPVLDFSKNTREFIKLIELLRWISRTTIIQNERLM